MQDSEEVLCSSSDNDSGSTSSAETLDSDEDDDDDDDNGRFNPEKQKTHKRQPSFYPQMPVSNPNLVNQSGQGQRTTFRPPWVKEAPTPLPMPAAPWTASKSREADAADSRNGESSAQPRKQSKITIIPSNPAVKENGKATQASVGQQSKEVRVPRKTEKVVPISIETKSVKKEPEIPVAPPIPPPITKKAPAMENNAPPMPPPPPPMPPSANKKPPIAETDDESESSESSDSDSESESTETESISDTETDCTTTDVEIQEMIDEDDDELETASMCGGQIIAFPDEMEPMYSKGDIVIPQEEKEKKQFEFNRRKEKKPISKEKEAKLEALRARPRRRPDWTDMMKEVEQGAKLKHVQCNDRSAPILPEAKAKGQFVYESEKDNAHNQLLKQIQTGVRLKKTRTNDRSRPVLDGLRKFRRQMTIEEQIQKSTSVADVVALAAEPDELDDIDKVRDDLQSAKQMLALELRNKEGLERENKRLMARLLNLEVELEKEKATKHIESERAGAVVQVKTEEDEKLIQKLKEEASEAAAVAKEMEDKYQKIAEELDSTRAKLESAWLRNQQIELQLKAYEKGSPVTQISKQPSSKKLAASMASMPNGRSSLVPSEQESEYEEETEESESEEDTDDKDSEAAQERRQQREMKLLTTKVKSFKSKMNNALKERHKLKDMLKKQQKMVREEKKKYKLLQKEVDKMAKLMKDVDEEDLEEEEEEKDVEEEETETESESEESEEDNDDSDDECLESATPDETKKKLNEKAKRYENRLSSLKKGNYLLKANIDRLQDDLNRQKEMSLALQEDLNSVLAELG